MKVFQPVSYDPILIINDYVLHIRPMDISIPCTLGRVLNTINCFATNLFYFYRVFVDLNHLGYKIKRTRVDIEQDISITNSEVCFPGPPFHIGPTRRIFETD